MKNNIRHKLFLLASQKINILLSHSMLALAAFLCMSSSFSMQNSDTAGPRIDPKQIELEVYKKYFLPAEIQESFSLAEQGVSNPFARTVLVHAPYSMRPSLVARAMVELYGSAARYEKFLAWHPTICAEMQKTVQSRLEQDSQAPIVVYINDLSRAGRELDGRKRPGCEGVEESLARFLFRYFGREGEWKNSPVFLVASATELDSLSDRLKNIFQKTVSPAFPMPETRILALKAFLGKSRKLLDNSATEGLKELTEGAGFEELRTWSEALVKKAVLTPTAIVNAEVLSSAREGVLTVIAQDRAEEKKLRGLLQAQDEEKKLEETAEKPKKLDKLVSLLVPSVINTVSKKLIADPEKFPVRSILISGPRGVGKSTIAHACAETVEAPVLELSLRKFFDPSSFVQENGMLAMVKGLKKRVSAGKKGVLLIDDIELVTQVSSSLNSVDKGLLELRKKCLKEVLAAVQESDRLLCIATTSDIKNIDPEIRNSFYCQVPISLPNKEGRQAFLQHLILEMNEKRQGEVAGDCEQPEEVKKNLLLEATIKFEPIADRTDSFSCQNLRDLLGHATVLAYLDGEPLQNTHVERALSSIVAEAKGTEAPLFMYR